MSRGSQITDRLLGTIPRGVFGLVSVLIGVSGDIISALLFPGYDMSKNMISELGVGPGGGFFNMGVILSGIISIPYLIHLGNTLLDENNVKTNIRKFAITSSVLSGIALSLVGIFPADKTNYTIFLIHGLVATICYMGAIIYLSIYCSYMLKDERFLKIFSYIGFITAGLFVFVILTWIPLFQWIANIGLIIWTILVSSSMIYKKT